MAILVFSLWSWWATENFVRVNKFNHPAVWKNCLKRIGGKKNDLWRPDGWVSEMMRFDNRGLRSCLVFNPSYVSLRYDPSSRDWPRWFPNPLFWFYRTGGKHSVTNGCNRWEIQTTKPWMMFHPECYMHLKALPVPVDFFLRFPVVESTPVTSCTQKKRFRK